METDEYYIRRSDFIRDTKIIYIDDKIEISKDIWDDQIVVYFDIKEDLEEEREYIYDFNNNEGWLNPISKELKLVKKAYKQDKTVVEIIEKNVTNIEISLEKDNLSEERKITLQVLHGIYEEMIKDVEVLIKIDLIKLQKLEELIY